LVEGQIGGDSPGTPCASELAFGETCVWKCDQPTYLEGSGSLTCDIEGATLQPYSGCVSGETFDCGRIDSPLAAAHLIDNSVFYPFGNIGAGVVEGDNHFDSSGNGIAKCLRNKNLVTGPSYDVSWSTCNLKCDPYSGYASNEGTLSCVPYYDSNGNKVYDSALGVYVGVIRGNLTCEPVQCPAIADFPTGVVGDVDSGDPCVEFTTELDAVSDNTCNIKCDEDTHFPGSQTLECTVTGKRPNATLVCEARPLQCNAIESLGTGIVGNTDVACARGTVLDVGNVCNVRCDEEAGFKPANGTFTCLGDGSNASTTLSCEPKYCSPTEDVGFGSILGDDARRGDGCTKFTVLSAVGNDTCDIRCNENEGYESAQGVAYCPPSSSSSGTDPVYDITCVKRKCEPIDTFGDGVIPLNSSESSEGCALGMELDALASCTVKCDESLGFLPSQGLYVCGFDGGNASTSLECQMVTTTSAAPTITTTEESTATTSAPPTTTTEESTATTSAPPTMTTTEESIATTSAPPTMTTTEERTTTTSSPNDNNNAASTDSDSGTDWLIPLIIGLVLCCCCSFCLFLFLCCIGRRKKEGIFAPPAPLSVRHQTTIQI